MKKRWKLFNVGRASSLSAAERPLENRQAGAKLFWSSRQRTLSYVTALVVMFALPMLCMAENQAVEISVDPTCVRNIGGVTEFSRKQYITLHESFGSGDMAEADFLYFENELEAEYGRDGGFISWQAGQTPADPKDPDMPDINAMKTMVKEFRKSKKASRMVPEDVREVVLCTHPELMHAMPDNKHAEWGPRSYEAVAEYTAQLLKLYFSDKERPRYLEVYNEPFIKTDEIGTTVEAMCEQHNVVAKRVKELCPDVMVGGYSAAWVEVEARNFEHWNNWQKKFMDLAGENMDFFSYHIYDGVNVKGTPRNRTGSNSEAIMDLIDTYSHIKFGVAKPLMITEYSKIPEGNMKSMPYSAKRSAGMIYSANGQLFTYMDHPDRFIKVIPFFLGKALWTYGMKNEVVPGHANPFLLWRKKADGTFVKTDLIKFYQFWKGVEGEWRYSHSSNPDVRVHLLADGKQLTLAVMNLDTEPQTTNLTGLEGMKVSAVALRSLTTQGEEPVLCEKKLDSVPSELKLAPGESILLLIDTPLTINPKNEIYEHRVYATEYLKDIEADVPVKFKFVDVPTGQGHAVLRLSAGRKKDKQVLPSSVKFNGKRLEIPSNWAGGDQAGRPVFFGMIEIPVPMERVKKTNNVRVTYPDDGGKVACAVLQTNVKIGN